MKKLCFLLLSLVLVLSCRQGMEFDSSPRSNIEALWDIIDRRYCFLPYKAETIGLDWNRVREKYTAQVSPDMNSAQLFEVMSNMLAELQDGHVNLYYSADMSRYWSWHEDYPRNFDEDLRDRYLGKDYKIAAGLKYRILDDNTGYVVYESFSSGIGDGNIDEVLYYLRSCNGLILDIRGNGGGMLTNAERLTSHFTNQRTLVGYTMHKTGPGHNDFSTPQPEYINPSTGIRWQKPVVLLTNRECYSSANVFVRNMKCLDNVTILGDRTGGGGGLPFTSELPCGWAVRFSACPTMDAQMQHTEFGIEPHIHCTLDSADQAKGMDTLIEKARTLLK
ncbi:MAG: S41 family peptidase [Bacteroidaceae bacterium]|nr:S41 family peptidase [Bacteroidaceae bacterium]